MLHCLTKSFFRTQLHVCLAPLSQHAVCATLLFVGTVVSFPAIVCLTLLSVCLNLLPAVYHSHPANVLDPATQHAAGDEPRDQQRHAQLSVVTLQHLTPARAPRHHGNSHSLLLACS